jgi:hypothetical protein
MTAPKEIREVAKESMATLRSATLPARATLDGWG